jgi:ABC-type antimicrobial peptide transport system permease subunit
MILGDVGRIMIAGVAVGCLLALGAGRGIGSLLFGLNPDDVMTLAAAAGVLLICGFVSAAWPARRAAGIDPVKVLREG